MKIPPRCSLPYFALSPALRAKSAARPRPPPPPRRGGGLVFLKEGLTSMETFWLHRTGRGEDTWVLRKPAEGR